MSETRVTAGSDSARTSRYEALKVLWLESQLNDDGSPFLRVRSCRRIVVGSTVTLATGGAGSGARGLETCGSVWSCPVCSERVNKARRDELATGLEGWTAEGGAVHLLTLTMRHSEGMALHELWDAVAKGWTAVVSGRQWREEQRRLGVVGYVRVVEVTHGANGWHVHVHALLFTLGRGELSAFERYRWETAIFGRWVRKLIRLGYTAERAHGIDLTATDGTSVGGYLVKNTYDAVAFEVTNSHGKHGRGGSRTPFEILADVVKLGMADDLDLWHEWERASKGRRQLTWSQGMRDHLRLAAEQSDLELASAAPDGSDVASFDAADWYRHGLAYRMAAMLSALDADPTGSRLLAMLRTWGVPHVDVRGSGVDKPPDRHRSARGDTTRL